MTVRDSTKPLVETGDRLMDLFWKTKPRAVNDEWRARFEHHVATVMRVRSLPRLEAERVAYETVLVEFLNASHPDTDPHVCAHCGRAETPNAILLPIGASNRHAWLHSDCRPLWREARKVKAIAELTAMKIEAASAAVRPLADLASIDSQSGAKANEASGSSQQPEPDYALVYYERIRLAGDDGRKEEVQLRALEAVVNLYRNHHPGVDIDTAKAEVLAAISRASDLEKTAP